MCGALYMRENEGIGQVYEINGNTPALSIEMKPE